MVANLDREGVHEALVLVGQLTLETDSHYAAEVAGGSQFLGWSEDRRLLAHISDTLFVILNSLGGREVIRDQLWTRPQQEEVEVGTIADFDTLAFKRMLSS